MRNLRSVCLAVISLLLPALAAASDEVPQVGKAAPQLTLSKVLQAPAGADVKWNALRGKVVVIDFWATWCAPCRESIPHWNQLVDAFADKPVRFVAITDENDQVVREFLKRTPIHGWIGLGGVGRSTHDAYGVEGIPATFIINQKGVVVAATHPAHLEAKHIREVLETGTSSLTTPAAGVTGDHAGKEIVERVPASRAQS